jgi:hypothetical protein
MKHKQSAGKDMQTKLSPTDAQGMNLSRDRCRQLQMSKKMRRRRRLTAEVTFRAPSEVYDSISFYKNTVLTKDSESGV